MNQVVITLPVGKSSAYVQENKVYSIQKNRKLLEKLKRGKCNFWAYARKKGGV